MEADRTVVKAAVAAQAEAGKALPPEEPGESKNEAAKKWMMNFMENNYVVMTVLIATVYALFGTDIWLYTDPSKDLDPVVYWLSTVTFVLFVLEWMIYCWAQPEYLWSFFFYLDFIAALSLAPDVFYAFGIILINSSGNSSSLTFARAGRAARAGTRAVRFVRIFKILTLVKKKTGTVSSAEQQQLKPSKVGTKLMDLITQKVIVIVALMLILSSVLDALVEEVKETEKEALENLEYLYQLVGAEDEAFQAAKAELLASETNAVYLSIDNNVLYPTDYYQIKEAGGEFSWELLRENPPMISRYIINSVWPDKTEHVSMMFIDDTEEQRKMALSNIIQILFIIALLAASSWLFSRDSQKLVINPLEKMAHLVERLSENTLLNVDDDVKEEVDEVAKLGGDEGQMETDFVETSLKKFVKLLQIAFGEVGLIRVFVVSDSHRVMEPNTGGRRDHREELGIRRRSEPHDPWSKGDGHVWLL
jgi:hypothetical protein